VTIFVFSFFSIEKSRNKSLCIIPSPKAYPFTKTERKKSQTDVTKLTKIIKNKTECIATLHVALPDIPVVYKPCY